jgi:glutathione S-transferase
MILLLEKNVDFETTYIDLKNKPDWFLKMSPLGKVPVLVVDHDSFLFESHVICEYIDETYGQLMHPAAPLKKAFCRSWMEVSSVLLALNYRFITTPNPELFESTKADIQEKLDDLERNLGDGPFFLGTSFSLVDAFYAPAFRYFELLAEVGEDFFAQRPRLKAWSEVLRVRPSVRNSVPPDYSARMKDVIRERGGLISSHFVR